ncbi:MAG TPA: beta-galactosidase [Pyrinomonadaceae bacterium]|nr:beta-galactosidase [Pyrinomonadaceae bacterium]
MANLPRRRFLKTIGGAAVATALPHAVLGTQTPKFSVAVLWEPEFRAYQGCEVDRETLQHAVAGFNAQFLNERDLIAQLDATRFDLLITPYGSAFPKRIWPTLLKYLRDGGNWFNIGGVPLSRPVIRDDSKWLIEPAQASYHKRLGITHSFPIETSTYKVVDPIWEGGFKADKVYELYVRLSSTNNEPDEAGSDGPHEGVVQPLSTIVDDNGRRVVAPVIQIDRLRGEFAGGRWVFANFNGSIDGRVISMLALKAALGATRFEVRPDFVCYKSGELPTLTVEVLRPKGDWQKFGASKVDFYIRVRDKNDAVVSSFNLTVNAENSSATGSVKFSDAAKLTPGFYKVEATATTFPLTHHTGFWIYDATLLATGKPLTVDNHFFYRDGRVFPVTGTTYMSSDKHRRYLFEPNPFVWDNDFRAMREAGVNMVRTGIWTGWKKYMPEPGKVDEAVLRAFDAFLLTAHKYDIPVIFTFFAFLPETWGGENAYLDPRSVKAQQQFISAFTERCRRVDDVLWDFINEPSFCSPKFLWNCRPNYDAHEQAAWKQWLRDRYPAANDEERLSKLQTLWRSSDESLDLPKLQDFESVHLIDDRLPIKTLDYRLFAQDMFIRWVRAVTPAIRSNGNTKQLITVGQDEAGLGDSPNIQFFANEIDFTSLHNWWNNDDLLWDSVLAKTPSKMSLMEETGVMFYEKADGGAPWRSEQDVSNLLERKMALSFAADGAGFVEWIWNTNPYMNSTNEVGIGFHRVDGSAKPELEPFLRIAKFMAQHGHRLQERVSEPVALVIPHSQMFSPRSFAHEATRRAVRALYYHLGVPVQAVSEYTIKEYEGRAKVIVVPSPRVLTDDCWNTLEREANHGATVAISGAIDLNEHWLPSEKFPQRVKESRPVAETEAITIGTREYLLRYDGEKMQRLEAAAIEPPVRPLTFDYRNGGKLLWSTLPLELSDSMPAVVAFYRMALAQARVAPIFSVFPRTPAVLILPSVFRDVVLYTFVSEASRDTRMQVTHVESRSRFNVMVPAQRTAMVIIERKSGRVLATDERG